MKLLTSILLLLTSLLLSWTVCTFAFMYALFRLIGHSAAYCYLYFYRAALGFDEAGNTVCSMLFNDCIIKKDGYKFGMPGETVSSAIGKNVEKGTLTVAGRALNWVLNRIQKNHSVLSINGKLNNTNK